MTHVGVSEEAGEGTVAVRVLRERFGVDALIRLQKVDFTLPAGIGNSRTSTWKQR